MSAAEVTELSTRLMWTALGVIVIAFIYFLMWRSWRRRARVEFPALLPIPHDLASEVCARALYASTTSQGKWMERVHARGLGARARARICVSEAGIAIDKPQGFLIPKASIVGISLAPGIAGKVVGGRGLVVISWQWQGELLDTGLLPENEERELLLRALAPWMSAGGGA